MTNFRHILVLGSGGGRCLQNFVSPEICWRLPGLSLYFTSEQSLRAERAHLQGSCLPKQRMLQVALELVKKEMEEALTQEANVGKKTIIWKVRQSCGSRDLAGQ